ncbi:unnamed protein product [Didymodactylos carnosus]|uniref:Carboxylesterase type B domain-containing protein n=1 Tax=Didymodactylos carnosus TaxID=1234261 RepID=A0A814NS48_9BILA|nr:unnamed protein product [Didymodactylos carnosus]CAF1145649.1 unnamed protein product [Didymodactylos carnosus]CAF3862850.1 unnamed protein product [Didymodactylos carnosus]CAF3946962.1 unnamed protein product [Didymodactylos carnosus]
MLITVIKNLFYHYSCTVLFCFNYYTCLTGLFYFHSINAITDNECPTYEHIIDQLLFNQTLPPPCQTLINFSLFNNDSYILKSAAYNHQNKHVGPFLVSSTGIYHGKRVKYNNNTYIDQFLGIYYAELPVPLQKPVKKHFSYTIQNATTFGSCCRQSLLMTENLSYGSFFMKRNFDDNCLSLNIYRSDLRFGERKKAITIFSHGGSNQIGNIRVNLK